MRRKNHAILFVDAFGEYHGGKSCFSIIGKVPKTYRR